VGGIQVGIVALREADRGLEVDRILCCLELLANQEEFGQVGCHATKRLTFWGAKSLSLAACLIAAHLSKDMEVPVCLLHSDEGNVAGCDGYSVLSYMGPRGEILKGGFAEVWAVEDRHGC